MGWTAYGAGKVNSLGSAPELAGAGTPSVAVNDFRATLLFGVPGAFGVLIHSDQKASQPFQGGTLHLATRSTPPSTLRRSAARSLATLAPRSPSPTTTWFCTG